MIGNRSLANGLIHISFTHILESLEISIILHSFACSLSLSSSFGLASRFLPHRLLGYSTARSAVWHLDNFSFLSVYCMETGGGKQGRGQRMISSDCAEWCCYLISRYIHPGPGAVGTPIMFFTLWEHLSVRSTYVFALISSACGVVLYLHYCSPDSEMYFLASQPEGLVQLPAFLIDLRWLKLYVSQIHARYLRWINSLWPNDAICWQGSRSILVQIMACCLMAPSH